MGKVESVNSLIKDKVPLIKKVKIQTGSYIILDHDRMTETSGQWTNKELGNTSLSSTVAYYPGLGNERPWSNTTNHYKTRS